MMGDVECGGIFHLFFSIQRSRRNDLQQQQQDKRVNRNP
jgi:hypothetical protein